MGLIAVLGRPSDLANVLEKKTFSVDCSRGCRHVTYPFCYIVSHLNFELYPSAVIQRGGRVGLSSVQHGKLVAYKSYI